MLADALLGADFPFIALCPLTLFKLEIFMVFFSGVKGKIAANCCEYELIIFAYDCFENNYKIEDYLHFLK